MPAPKNGEQAQNHPKSEGAESTSSQQSMTSKETSPANTPGKFYLYNYLNTYICLSIPSTPLRFCQGVSRSNSLYPNVSPFPVGK